MYSPVGKIYIISSRVDMRKSINALGILMSTQYEKNPSTGDKYVFINSHGDKIKVLYFDGNGFVLHYKRLEKCRVLVERSEGCMLEISPLQLAGLLSGLEVKNLKIPGEGCYEAF